MKNSVVCFLFVLSGLLASGQAEASVPDFSARTTRDSLIGMIGSEKIRIGKDYKSADSRLFNLIDSVCGFVESLPVNPDKKNIYLERLHLYLTNINRYYSDSYLKNGTYLAVLSYYPVILEWDIKGDLSRNLARYIDFSIKATKLIPDDLIAEEFLMLYMKHHPDEIFRYFEEYEERKFALRLLEKAVRLAPESAKRYYASASPLNDLLRKSNDLFVRTTYSIYRSFGIRSRAYLLIDAIVDNSLTLKQADSLTNNPDLLYALLVKSSMRYEATPCFSVYRYTENYCIDAMRRVNTEVITGTAIPDRLIKMSPEELFLLLAYGHRETAPANLIRFLDLLESKAGNVPLNSNMISVMDKNNLKKFIIYSDNNKMLDKVLGLVDDEKKDYLLTLSALEENTNVFPPFKTFQREPPALAPANDTVNHSKIARSPLPGSNLATYQLQHPPVPIKEEEIRQKTGAENIRKPEEVQANASAYTENEKKVSGDRLDIPLTEKPGQTLTQPNTTVKVLPEDLKTALVAGAANKDSETVTPAVGMNENGQQVRETAAAEPPEPAVSAPNATAPKTNDDATAINPAPQPIQLTVREPILEARAAKTPPDAVPVPVADAVTTPVKITLDNRTKTIMQLKKNILQTIQKIPAFLDQDYAEELLRYAAAKEPDELLKKTDAFKSKRWSLQVLEQCAINAPVSIKRYLYNPNHPVNYVLRYSRDPAVKKIMEINAQLGYQSKPLLLLDDILSGALSVKDATETSNEPSRLFGAMVKILSRKEFVGHYSLDREMRYYSLRFIRDINDKIAAGAYQPYSSAEGLSSAELYFLMLSGRDEVFTNTFNGLFDRFMRNLPEAGAESFMQSVNFNQSRNFLSLCANFGVLDEFLAKFSTDSRTQLLQNYVSQLEQDSDQLSDVVMVAEALSNLQDQQLLKILQTELKKEYERVAEANDPFGTSIYGVLSSIIADNAKTELNWFRQQSKKFQVTSAHALSVDSLFGTNSLCVEQMYFYNDDDGRSSFLSFVNTYKGSAVWGFEDMGSYVRIFSKEGRRIDILANKPEYQESGVVAISAYLGEKKISPSVIVHRGHSFYTESTLEKVPEGARLIFVGSCGGFYKLSAALQNAPEAHIIATRQIGTKSVNDVILFHTNEQIRTGKEIIWNEFWDKIKDRLGSNPYFSDYVPPNKNLESIFIRAYYKILGIS